MVPAFADVPSPCSSCSHTDAAATDVHPKPGAAAGSGHRSPVPDDTHMKTVMYDLGRAIPNVPIADFDTESWRRLPTE